MLNGTGEQLKILRQLKRLKQPYVAGLLGIKQQSYSEIEMSADIEAMKFRKIVSLMEYTPEDIEQLRRFLP